MSHLPHDLTDAFALVPLHSSCSSLPACMRKSEVNILILTKRQGWTQQQFALDIHTTGYWFLCGEDAEIPTRVSAL